MVQLQAAMFSVLLALQRMYTAGIFLLQSLQPLKSRWQVFCGQFQHNLTKAADPESIRNHHIAGVAVIGLALVSYIEESKGEKAGWIRYIWPGLLFVMGIAIIGWADPGTWPDGPKPLAQDAEAIQHKFFALFALALATIELLRRTGKLTHKAWSYVFSGTMICAGTFLLFHQGEHAHIVHLQHLAMGTMGVAVGVAQAANNGKTIQNWLRLHLYSLFILGLGALLLFYVE
ncbi:MAG TPA: hypothetical protein VFB76_15900 [Candidatus Angelobacter sp.]|nr:hypothetical protein [Candidatus Angelobacter sp.]